MTRRKKPDTKPKTDECIETTLIPPSEKWVSSKRSPEHQKRDVRRYMSIEAPDETVLHVEKVTTEVVAGTRYDVWDVHTDKHRWWVINNLLNLYAQEHFPSQDMCLTFHVGLMARMSENRPRDERVSPLPLLRAYRQLEAAEEALERALEPEDYQAVGLRCRECLLELTRELSSGDIVPEGIERPKSSDFLHWSEHIANWVTRGPSLARMRSYLKSIAQETWQVVNWVTHARGAQKRIAEFAVRATSQTLWEYGMAFVQRDDEAHEQCPRCGSYQLFQDFRPEIDEDKPYWMLCERCEWERGPEDGR